MYSVVILFAFIAFNGLVSSANIPSYIHICRRTDPQVDKCIIDSTEHIRDKLKDGIPELGVPSLEPFKIPNVVVSRGTGNTHFQLELQDVEVYGASAFHIVKLKVDVPNHTFKVEITIPQLYTVGKYVVDAQLLTLPIKGFGKFEGNATNCVGSGVLKGDLKVVNGESHIHFTNLDLNFKLNDYFLKVEHAGDDTLGQSINQLVLENKDEILKLATPTIAQKASEILLEIANKIVVNFSYDDVFPEK